MAARGDLRSHAGDVLFDAASLAAIVAFWLLLVVGLPWIAADVGVPPSVIALATLVSVTAYLGMRWWTTPPHG
ncbi:MAG: hypothetical protein ACOC0X_05640 [Halobacteriota archaeon]